MLGSSGMQIFAGIVICFFYVLLASYIEPLTSKTGQMLQYVTSIQLFCTLISGLMITHRTYEREKGIGNEAQDVALAVWLMFSTIVVFIAIVLVVGSVMLIFKKPKKPDIATKPDETLGSIKTTKPKCLKYETLWLQQIIGCHIAKTQVVPLQKELDKHEINEFKVSKTHS